MNGKKYTSIESAAAITLVYWGLSVANPFFDTFKANNKIFAPMSQIAPEFVWGLFYFFCGSFAFFFLIKNNFRKAQFLSFLGLLSIAALFLLGDYRSYAWGIYFIPAILNFIKWRVMKWKVTRS